MGKTVKELLDSLTEAEYQDWLSFYVDYPFDDRHRYYRPAALSSACFAGGKDGFKRYMDILQPISEDDLLTDADKSVLKAFGFGG